MAWLYVPNLTETSCRSAQALEGLNSASCSPSTIGERLAGASATWRGKPLPPLAWSRRWTQGGFIRHLSGLTCSPSMLDHGVESFISSLRATHARTTVWQENGPGLVEPASLPRRSAASPKSAGLILSSAKTCRGTQTDSLRPSSRHWKGWATALRQDYSVRPRPLTPCDGNDCSSWPTARVQRGGYTRDRGDALAQRPTLEGMAQNWAGPQARDHFPAHSDSYIAAKKAQGHGMRNLSDEAPRWAAPMTADARGSAGVGKNELPNQAQAWPGPQARDHKGVNRAMPLDHNSRPLNEVASLFHPPSYPAQPIAGGPMSSTDFPNSNHPSVKRRLNPIFVEALMRWPTGLSGFARLETAWTRWWLLMPSFLSALVSASELEPQGDLFGVAA